MRRASPFSFGSTPSSMSKRIASAAEPLAFWMKRSRLPGTNIQERACFLVAPDMLLAPVKTARNEHPSPHGVNETFPERQVGGHLRGGAQDSRVMSSVESMTRCTGAERLPNR